MITPAKYSIYLNWVSKFIGIQLYSWRYYHELLPFGYGPQVNIFLFDTFALGSPLGFENNDAVKSL